MIFVLEHLDSGHPQAWFAFDDEDLLRKVAALDLDLLRRTQQRLGSSEPAELAEAALAARGTCRVYRTEAQATAAYERTDDPAWQGEGWRARWALRDQLIAMEVLADDL
jgi:hypothetical protein